MSDNQGGGDSWNLSQQVGKNPGDFQRTAHRAKGEDCLPGGKSTGETPGWSPFPSLAKERSMFLECFVQGWVAILKTEGLSEQSTPPPAPFPSSDPRGQWVRLIPSRQEWRIPPPETDLQKMAYRYDTGGSYWKVSLSFTTEAHWTTRTTHMHRAFQSLILKFQQAKPLDMCKASQTWDQREKVREGVRQGRQQKENFEYQHHQTDDSRYCDLWNKIAPYETLYPMKQDCILWNKIATYETTLHPMKQYFVLWNSISLLYKQEH